MKKALAAAIVVMALAGSISEDIHEALCDTDSDCAEKYPCGEWYGNHIYSIDMTEGQKIEVYERCLDEVEGRQI